MVKGEGEVKKEVKKVAPKKATPKPPKVYKVIQKFNYDHKNYDIDDVLPKFPKDVIKELLKAKAIE